MSRDLQLVWSALEIDPWQMAWSFSRKLCNSWPVQKNGSKTWTGKLLDTLLVGNYYLAIPRSPFLRKVKDQGHRVKRSIFNFSLYKLHYWNEAYQMFTAGNSKRWPWPWPWCLADWDISVHTLHAKLLMIFPPYLVGSYLATSPSPFISKVKGQDRRIGMAMHLYSVL